MLHIIWLLLKIIGIIILALVLLILAIILIVLFIPISYRAHLTHGDEIYLKGKVHWFLSVISIPIMFENNVFSIKFRIFGKLIFDSQNKNNKKIKKKKRKNEKKIKKDQKKNKDINTEEELGISENNKKEIDIIDSKYTIQNSEEKIQKGNNLFKKIKRAYKKIINTPAMIKKKIKELIIKIINGIKSIYNKFISLYNKLNMIKDFIDDVNNKKAIKQIIKNLKKVLKHIKPKKIKSFTTFGTEDPSTTGQILGVLSALGIGLRKEIKIIPDFENSIFEGNHYISGRIRISFLLIIIIRLITNKEFKKMQTNFNNLKEAL